MFLTVANISVKSSIKRVMFQRPMRASEHGRALVTGEYARFVLRRAWPARKRDNRTRCVSPDPRRRRPTDRLTVRPSGNVTNRRSVFSAAYATSVLTSGASRNRTEIKTADDDRLAKGVRPCRANRIEFGVFLGPRPTRRRPADTP